jgi:hypothetical protein
MSAITAWSYSRYATYALCPLQFKFKFIDKLPEPGSPAMQRGKDIHDGTANYITGKSSTLPRDAMKNDVIVDLIQQIKAFPNKEVEQQWGYTSNWEPSAWFDRGGVKVWFRSVLDVGVMYDDLEFEAVDWKTGKRYGSNNDQMETQALAVFKRFKPVKKVTTRLAYMDEAGANPFEFDEFRAEQSVSLAKKWEKKVEPMFTDTVFAPRPNEKCRFCFQAKSAGGKCAFG